MNKTSQDINIMIQLCIAEPTTRTIAQMLDILTALNERMDVIESITKQIQNERNYPNT